MSTADAPTTLAELATQVRSKNAGPLVERDMHAGQQYVPLLDLLVP